VILDAFAWWLFYPQGFLMAPSYIWAFDALFVSLFLLFLLVPSSWKGRVVVFLLFIFLFLLLNYGIPWIASLVTGFTSWIKSLVAPLGV